MKYIIINAKNDMNIYNAKTGKLVTTLVNNELLTDREIQNIAKKAENEHLPYRLYEHNESFETSRQNTIMFFGVRRLISEMEDHFQDYLNGPAAVYTDYENLFYPERLECYYADNEICFYGDANRTLYLKNWQEHLNKNGECEYYFIHKGKKYLASNFYRVEGIR